MQFGADGLFIFHSANYIIMPERKLEVKILFSTPCHSILLILDNNVMYNGNSKCKCLASASLRPCNQVPTLHCWVKNCPLQKPIPPSLSLTRNSNPTETSCPWLTSSLSTHHYSISFQCSHTRFIISQ